VQVIGYRGVIAVFAAQLGLDIDDVIAESPPGCHFRYSVPTIKLARHSGLFVPAFPRQVAVPYRQRNVVRKRYVITYWTGTR